MPSPRQFARNARLLLQSAAQHAVDDPALLAVQVSRRLPFAIRVRTRARPARSSQSAARRSGGCRARRLHGR